MSYLRLVMVVILLFQLGGTLGCTSGMGEALDAIYPSVGGGNHDPSNTGNSHYPPSTELPPEYIPPVVTDEVSPGQPPSFSLISSVSGRQPFAFGQGFRQGDVPESSSVYAADVVLQVNILNRWPDGSAKFAVISGETELIANEFKTVKLLVGNTTTSGTHLAEADLSASGVDAEISLAGSVFLRGLIGKTATYSSPLGRFTGGLLSVLLSGPEMSSFIYYAPMDDPHLAAFFEIRIFKNGSIEILPYVENGYLNVANPGTRSGVATFKLDGFNYFEQDLVFKNHTRTPLVNGSRFTYWRGPGGGVAVVHDTKYLQKTRLVPSYRGNGSGALLRVIEEYTPFLPGRYPAVMGSTGYHMSIGVLPEWDVGYLLSGADPRSYKSVIAQAYAAGRYPIHYRDETTNRPFRFSQYPNLGISSTNSGVSGVGSFSATTPANEAGSGGPKFIHSHHPSIGYFAYLITGRRYFLEELQFVASINRLTVTPRNPLDESGNVIKTQKQAGLFIHTIQERAAAWSLRTLSQAAALTPDDDILKTEYVESLEQNINYHYNRYIAQPHNLFGFLQSHNDYTPGVAPTMAASWQQDFLVAAFGYMKSLKLVNDIESEKLRVFFDWKAQSVVGRLGACGDVTQFCFTQAAPYNFPVTPDALANVDWAHGTGPWYPSWGAMFEVLTGVPNDTPTNVISSGRFPNASSYWGNIQPAIAFAVQNGVPGALEAYQRMTGATNWSEFVDSANNYPVWAIMPSE